MMPYIPPLPIGVGMDYLGFIWFMLMLMLSGSSVLAHLTARYVHASPTLYDRLLNRAHVAEYETEQQAAKEKAAAAKAAELPNGAKVVLSMH